MLILFSLISMRMSGMVLFNPILGSNTIPGRVKAALIMTFSMMLYMWTGGTLQHEPGSLFEYGIMLGTELLMGFVLGFAVTLAVFAIRYAAAIIDFTMGLSMAQVYDPETKNQITVSSEMLYVFLMLLFFAVNGHLRLVSIFFGSASIVPFGQATFGLPVYTAILDIFRQSITLGVQLAFPIIAMELVTEAAVGIMMRMIPQINVFSINFQIKIIVGMLMLLFLFSPIADKMSELLRGMLENLGVLLRLMG
ncbi:MAG: flagellar biosynthetic protein FliR [Lachnospiraceae bacterium]|nr:flagellar biosynthetic protein FliR [Lachnospiraceae bacterium]